MGRHTASRRVTVPSPFIIGLGLAAAIATAVSLYGLPAADEKPPPKPHHSPVRTTVAPTTSSQTPSHHPKTHHSLAPTFTYTPIPMSESFGPTLGVG